MPKDVKKEYEGLLSIGASQQSALHSLLDDAAMLADDAVGRELFPSQEAEIAWAGQFLEELVNLAMPIIQGHQIPIHW